MFHLVKHFDEKGIKRGSFFFDIKHFTCNIMLYQNVYGLVELLRDDRTDIIVHKPEFKGVLVEWFPKRGHLARLQVWRSPLAQKWREEIAKPHPYDLACRKIYEERDNNKRA